MYKKILDTFSTNVVTFIIGFALSILLARGLGPEGLGMRAFILLIPNTLYICLSLNYFASNVYFMRSETFAIEKILGASIIFYVFLTSLMLTVVVLAHHFWPLEFLPIILVLIVLNNGGNFVLTSIVGLGYIERRNRLLVVKSFVFFLLVMLLFFPFRSYFSLEIILYAEIFSTGAIVLYGLFFFFSNCRKVPDFSAFTLTGVLKEIALYSRHGYIANMCNYLNYRLDQWLIKIFLGPSPLGIYSVITTISERFWMLPSAIAMVLYPEIAKKKEYSAEIRSIDKMIVFSLLLGCVGWIAGFFLVEPVIVFLYGDDFRQAALIFLILFPGIILFSIVKIVAGFFAGLGRPDLRVKTAILSTIINAGLNVILIPKLGLTGAALSTLFSYCLYGVSILAAYINVRKSPEDFARKDRMKAV
jgi:O-antigen/teichoic acid export membrane protein